jgi:hypothetical protein
MQRRWWHSWRQRRRSGGRAARWALAGVAGWPRCGLLTGVWCTVAAGQGSGGCWLLAWVPGVAPASAWAAGRAQRPLTPPAPTPTRAQDERWRRWRSCGRRGRARAPSWLAAAAPAAERQALARAAGRAAGGGGDAGGVGPVWAGRWWWWWLVVVGLAAGAAGAVAAAGAARPSRYYIPRCRRCPAAAGPASPAGGPSAAPPPGSRPRKLLAKGRRLHRQRRPRGPGRPACRVWQGALNVRGPSEHDTGSTTPVVAAHRRRACMRRWSWGAAGLRLALTTLLCRPRRRGGGGQPGPSLDHHLPAGTRL